MTGIPQQIPPVPHTGACVNRLERSMKYITTLNTMLFFICLLPFMAHGETILVIESYHAENPWDASYKSGLKSVLGNRYDLEFFEMDTKRRPPSEYPNRARMAWEVYQRTKPVLVILGDDNALKYLGPELIKTRTPVVYLGINRNPREYNMIGHANITGILERPIMKRSIAFIGEIIKPRPFKVLILFDSGRTSKISLLDIFEGKSSLTASGIQMDLKLIGKLDDWKHAVLNAEKEGYDALIVGLFQTITDSSGKHVKADTILEWTSKNTPVPPFCFWDFAVGPDKTVGGLVLFGKTQGEEAGKMALEILSGKSPEKIMPVTGQRGRFLFSRSQLKKWGLTLPDDIASQSDYTP